ncbi:hypothetical protein VT50_0213325 [Streptomyces antioxidans]|uniref:Uncharacterized protein n=1 Tax=Streptomyces antioxidans TaxID=1507734 RepID=A0A1V4D7B9_9ACTN|nr:hypothetical protein [Streptomyces antioxidans]OPF80432.1 hypothetical protein VT50_0213325 [Streptomyces antioxidans]
MRPGRNHLTTTTVERGSFSVARCSCGWHGPARRARAVARDDAADHATARHSSSGTSDSSDSSE